jgi:L-histidine N-alpha-methyltransferase
MLREVWEGLARPEKELSPKYFYDARGSALFEEITHLPEYYLTKVERALLETWVPGWITDLAPVALVELGAGSAAKTRILLDALPARSSFVPLDVSEDLLHETARTLRVEYPHLTVTPEVADLTRPLELSATLPRPALFAFLGSTIGNFPRSQAVHLLSHVRASMFDGDAFLMGADLRPGRGKAREALEAAYNDSRGVTAEFNLNVLRVLNRELGANFDPRAFAHRAFYDDVRGRIEMHLVARCPQVVTLPGAGTVRFREGEGVRTEISCKYDRAAVDDLFLAAGLEVAAWREDDLGRYALVLGRPTGS